MTQHPLDDLPEEDRDRIPDDVLDQLHDLLEPTDLDGKVSENRQISLTRPPELGHRLVTGPYPYASTEQAAWISAATEIVQQFDRGTRPESIFESFAEFVMRAGGEIQVSADGDDLLAHHQNIDIRIRLGLDDNDEMVVEEEPCEESDSSE